MKKLINIKIEKTRGGLQAIITDRENNVDFDSLLGKFTISTYRDNSDTYNAGFVKNIAVAKQSLLDSRKEYTTLKCWYNRVWKLYDDLDLHWFQSYESVLKMFKEATEEYLQELKADKEVVIEEVAIETVADTTTTDNITVGNKAFNTMTEATDYCNSNDFDPELMIVVNSQQDKVIAPDISDIDINAVASIKTEIDTIINTIDTLDAKMIALTKKRESMNLSKAIYNCTDPDAVELIAINKKMDDLEKLEDAKRIELQKAKNKIYAVENIVSHNNFKHNKYDVFYEGKHIYTNDYNQYTAMALDNNKSIIVSEYIDYNNTIDKTINAPRLTNIFENHYVKSYGNYTMVSIADQDSKGNVYHHYGTDMSKLGAAHVVAVNNNGNIIYSRVGSIINFHKKIDKVRVKIVSYDLGATWTISTAFGGNILKNERTSVIKKEVESILKKLEKNQVFKYEVKFLEEVFNKPDNKIPPIITPKKDTRSYSLKLKTVIDNTIKYHNSNTSTYYKYKKYADNVEFYNDKIKSIGNFDVFLKLEGIETKDEKNYFREAFNYYNSFLPKLIILSNNLTKNSTISSSSFKKFYEIELFENSKKIIKFEDFNTIINNFFDNAGNLLGLE